MDPQGRHGRSRCFSGLNGMMVKTDHASNIRAKRSEMRHQVTRSAEPIGGASGILIGASDPQKMAALWGTDMQNLADTIRALTHGETDTIALMATMACEIHHAHPYADWTGFYRVVAPNLLKIGPYQGGHGCLVIPFSRGVCGACARTGQVLNVPDVAAFPDHIACSSTTLSELVLPVWNGAGRLLGVLDLDSNTAAAFTQTDQDWLVPLLAEVFRDAA
jgi:L-methionine (R)-S-oxide reductase